MRKFFFLFCILSLCYLSSTAQILNVEKSRLKADSANYFVGKVGFSLNINNRSTTAEDPTVFTGMVATSDVAYFSKLHSYILISQFNYQSLTGNPFISNGFGHFRTNFFRNRRVSYETFTQLQYDQGRGMESRFLAGGGIRYRVFEQDKSNFHVGTGLMYEQEIWKVPEDTDQLIFISLIKSTNYVSSKVQVTDNFDLSSIVYYQVGYDDDFDFFRHRISGEANFNFKITTRVNFKTTFNCAYENLPVVPVVQFVYSLTNGIEVNF